MAAVFFWPGSEVKIRGYRPSIYKDYDQSVPFAERVETAVRWFSEDQKDFVAIYFHQPDFAGHTHGPDSPEVADKVCVCMCVCVCVCMCVCACVRACVRE